MVYWRTPSPSCSTLAYRSSTDAGTGRRKVKYFRFIRELSIFNGFFVDRMGSSFSFSRVRKALTSNTSFLGTSFTPVTVPSASFISSAANSTCSSLCSREISAFSFSPRSPAARTASPIPDTALGFPATAVFSAIPATPSFASVTA